MREDSWPQTVSNTDTLFSQEFFVEHLKGFAPSNASLGALSFKLHKDLASAHNGRKTWGYSMSTGISLNEMQDSEAAVGGSGEDFLADGTSRAQATRSKSSERKVVPEWLKRADGGSLEEISTEGTVAQM
jgi:hypothetical protein